MKLSIKRMDRKFLLIFCFGMQIKLVGQCTSKVIESPMKAPLYTFDGNFNVYQSRIDTSVNNRNSFEIFCNLPNGKWKVLYITNRTAIQFCMKNEKMEGSLEHFYPNGSKSSVIRLRNNLRHGTCKHYYQNGKVWIKSNWKNGEIDGKWTYFNENGMKYLVKIFENGVLIKKEIYYQNVSESIKEDID